jgi:hypothetical protein
MTVSDGFTVWRVLPPEKVEPAIHRPASPAPDRRPVARPSKRALADRPYAGPIPKPSEAERQRRLAGGNSDAGDESWVPCPRCAESQAPHRRPRCELCDGRGMVSYSLVSA